MSWSTSPGVEKRKGHRLETGVAETAQEPYTGLRGRSWKVLTVKPRSVHKFLKEKAVFKDFKECDW